MPQYPGLVNASLRPAQSMRDVIAQRIRNGYTNARNSLAQTALNLGGQHSDRSAKEILHGEGNERLTEMWAALGFDPDTAANLSDAAYLMNELATGGMTKVLADRNFFSPQGFSWSDVAINRAAQDRAKARLRPEFEERKENQRALGALPIVRGGSPYGMPF